MDEPGDADAGEDGGTEGDEESGAGFVAVVWLPLAVAVAMAPGELPGHLQAEYRSLVEARNYLVHRLLFDHGGWKGIPGWDSPELYRKLYHSIGEAMQTIDRVTAT